MYKPLEELIETMSNFTIHADESKRPKAINRLLLDVFFLKVHVETQSDFFTKYLIELTGKDFEDLKLDYDKTLYKNMSEASAKFLSKYGNL